MEIMTSWDDGSKKDLIMASLLKKYKLPAIFFIPSIGTELSENEIKELSKDFLIGGHTVSHPMDIKLLNNEQQRQEILDNKVWLEDVIGKKIEWFCYPRGRFNETTIEILKEVGFSFGRTTLVGNIKTIEDIYRVAPTVHVLRTRKEYNERSWLEYAKEKYIEAEKENGCYHIWGHSWEIERDGLWNELEELFKYIYERNSNNRDNNNTTKA